MAYVCLYCLTTLTSSTATHTCTYTHNFSGIVPKKDVSALLTSIGTDTTYKVGDFNPSCRKVAFDCIINNTKNEIYIIVYANLDFVNNRLFGNWTQSDKDNARVAIESMPGLWDGHVTLRRKISTSAYKDYTPRFFLKSDTGWFAKRFNIEVETAQAPMALSDGTMTVMASAWVPTGTGYAPMSIPGYGSRHYHKMKVNRYSPQLLPTNTTQTNCEVMNPMAHEYGHMLGIPDEYLAIPTSWSQCNNDRDKAAYLWNQRVQSESMTPKYDYDMNYRNGLMSASIDARPVGFKPRYYVTVLEAARVCSTKHSLSGTWSLV